MKINIGSYLDYQDVSIDEQVRLFKDLKLTHFFVRKHNGKSISLVDDKSFSNFKDLMKDIKVYSYDPLLKTPHIHKEIEMRDFKLKLDKETRRAQELNAEYFIYRIPKVNDVLVQQTEFLNYINDHLTLIKKKKLSILIEPDDGNKSNVYRLIFENIKHNNVHMIFNQRYLYLNQESVIASYRLLRENIKVLSCDDVDPLGAGRLLGTGGFMDIKSMYKRFIENKFEGMVVLDSSLVDTILNASKYTFLEYKLSKRKNHERKIYNDYIQLGYISDFKHIIYVQLAVLNIVFLNKKIKME